MVGVQESYGGADWYASATIDGRYYAGEGDDQAEAIDDLWQHVRKAVKRG